MFKHRLTQYITLNLRGYSGGTLEPLRWRYKIQVDIEGTLEQAWRKGFSAFRYEGESRTRDHLFPLNQIEIKGKNLASNIKVVVSPNTTQIYLSVKDSTDYQELNRSVMDLEKAEQTLNDIVIFAPNEKRRYGIDTKIPVMTSSMLRTEYKLKKTRAEVVDNLTGLFLSDISRVFFHLAKRDITSAKKQIEVLSDEITRFARNFIEMAKEQGISGTEKFEEWLTKSTVTMNSLEKELTYAKSQSEIDEIVNRYWKKLDIEFSILKKGKIAHSSLF